MPTGVAIYSIERFLLPHLSVDMVSLVSDYRYHIVCFLALALSGVTILIGPARSALREAHFLAGLFHAMGTTETPGESVGLVAAGFTHPYCNLLFKISTIRPRHFLSEFQARVSPASESHPKRNQEADIPRPILVAPHLHRYETGQARM